MVQMSEAPCRYALLGMGSLARGDVTAYSDVELLLLLEEDSPKTLKYFRAALSVLQVYVMSLGESEGDSPGLHLDIPHLLSEEALFVTTPEKLVAKHYSLELSEQDLNQGERYSALSVVWISGNDEEALFHTYQTKLREQLSQGLDLGLPVPKYYRQQLAAAGLRYDVGQYQKLLGERFPADLGGWKLDIKARFVKPIVMLLQHLKVYFDLRVNHPVEIAKLLDERKQLPEGLSEKIALRLGLLQGLRLKLQERYGYQEDTIILSEANDFMTGWLKEADKLSLAWLDMREGKATAIQAGDIFEISREVIAPLHTLIQEWLLVEEVRPSPSGAWRVLAQDIRVYGLPEKQRPLELTRYGLSEARFHHRLSQLVWPESLVVERLSIAQVLDKEDKRGISGASVELSWLAVHGEGEEILHYRGVLRPEVSRKLVVPDTGRLNTEKRYPYANHAVHRLMIGEVDIHAKVYPELPGLEVAVYLLSQRLIGGGVPCMTVGRLSWADTKGKAQVESLLLSETVVGVDGATASQASPEWYEHIAIESFWEQMLLTLLTQPEDAKPDNFMLQRVLSSGGELLTKFWSIDQDHAFQEALVTTGKIRKQTVLQTKSILYCLNGMQLGLPESSKGWCGLSPQESLGAWLRDCYEYDTGLRWLFGKENIARYLHRVHTQKETQRTSVPILLEQETIEQLYMGLYRLQYHLGEQSNQGEMTFLSLLHLLQPQVALRYGVVLNEAKHPLKRFGELTRHAYSVVVLGHHQSMRGNPQVRQSGLRVIPSQEDVLNRSRYSPEVCIGFLKKYLAELDKAVQQARLGLYRGEMGLFKALKYWYAQTEVINGIQFSVPSTREEETTEARNKERLLQAKLVGLLFEIRGRWHQLRLVGWWFLTDVSLKLLLEKYKDLHTLDVSGCVGLTNKGLETIQIYAGSSLVVLKGRELRITELMPGSWFGLSYGFGRLETLDLSGCVGLRRVELKGSKFLKTVRLRGCRHLEKLALAGSETRLNLESCSQLTEELLRDWIKESTGISRLALDRNLVLGKLDKALISDYPMLLRIPKKMAQQWCAHYRAVEERLAKGHQVPFLGERGLLNYGSVSWQLSYQAGLQRVLVDWLVLREQRLPDVITGLLRGLKDEDQFVRSASAYALGELGDAREAVIMGLLLGLKDEKSSVRWVNAYALGELGDAREAVIMGLLSGLKDGDMYVRRASAYALGELGDAREAVIMGLLLGLKDEKSSVRFASAYALGELGDAREAVIMGLLSGLKDGDMYVRRASAKALDKLGAEREAVIAVLLSGLKNGNSDVRWASVQALGKLRVSRDEVLAVLLSGLKDGDMYVRRASAYALGELGDAREAVIMGLLLGLKDEKSSVRSASAYALGELGDKREGVTMGLLSGLKDEDVYVRYASVKALDKLGDVREAVIAVLLSRLKDGNWGVRYSNPKALGKLRDVREAVIAVLLSGLKDGKSDVRKASVEALGAALGELEDTREAVIKHLLSRLKDRKSSVCVASAQALVALGVSREVVIAGLLVGLKNGEKSVRRASADALGKLRVSRDEVLAVLLSGLKDEDQSVRFASAQVLGKLEDKREGVIMGLLSGLKDEDVYVRCASAAALGELEDKREEVIMGLLSGLKDEDVYVRCASAAALGELEDKREEVIAGLLVQLKDEDSSVRVASAEALGRLGDARDEVIAAFLARLKDGDSSARILSVMVLGRLGDARDEVIVAFLVQLKDGDSSVRSASAAALSSLLGVGLGKQLERYMRGQFKPILMLATQQPSPPQSKFFRGPRVDPCQRLTAEPLHQLFSWFQPKTLSASRLVSRRWHESIVAYEGALKEALPAIRPEHLSLFSQAVNLDITLLGLRERKGEIKILSCDLSAEGRGYTCEYREGSEVKMVRLPISQIARLFSEVSRNANHPSLKV